ncbi:MAG: hypothetical protein DCC57_22405 [Chloroflexi bacterium]|nr:MAG: hypothetical protein DCC57_22405 [Chloroflexota bacterium]
MAKCAPIPPRRLRAVRYQRSRGPHRAQRRRRPRLSRWPSQPRLSVGRPGNAPRASGRGPRAGCLYGEGGKGGLYCTGGIYPDPGAAAGATAETGLHDDGRRCAPPISVVLVGDGTWDPHNYENKAHYTNYVPPYLAQVDPWLGEAACDNCYGQLDGDDPLTGDQRTDSPTAFFATDLWVGRLPVKSAGELAALVDKILRYENDPQIGDWRNVNLFLADNYIKRLDEWGEPVRDMAGDFARLSDLIIRRALCARVGDPNICQFTGANSDVAVAGTTLNEQIRNLTERSGLRLPRYYYDPFPFVSDPEGKQPWRVADPQALRTSALAALGRGAGLVVFAGHSNHWQWAVLDGESNLPLVILNDPDGLANRDRLFITLSMTCLTAQFHKPADSGTTLDERFLLAPNGAVAVWGPAGLSVVHGHDALQRGFFETLWRAEPGSLRLGELVTGGYFELLTNSVCCQDVLRTYVLLGDPLTPARVMPLEVAHLPLISR